ncbi:alpha-1,2-fucosyltransferase [Propionibacteriaceae bacterium Y1923]|uniref:alpha-1,2-fucosyltransferase n=1 Tax=Aestuariimicrobium sp. Y1814 TaxID=3418742 RepID=UPI003C24031B
MKGWLRRLATAPLDRVRARSHRMVHLVPPSGVGIGNILYILLEAHRVRLDGREGLATRTAALEPWLDVFPGLAELVIGRREMRLTDARRHGWFQQFESFESVLDSFIQERMLTAPQWPGVAHDVGTVTVNVRRGDYYAVREFRELYGFNIAEYVRLALAGSAAQAPITSVRVVSDDIDWCKQHLGFVKEYGHPMWQSPGDGPVQNLLDLARSRRLVLANSTFSYWGGYMSSVAHGDNHELIWAPGFHTRTYGDEVVAWQLDPRWTIVNQIPGGWGEPDE